jgi:hypothetical protein
MADSTLNSRRHWVCYVLRAADQSGREYVGIEPVGKGERIETHRVMQNFLGTGYHEHLEEHFEFHFGTIYEAMLLEMRVLIARMREVGIRNVRGAAFPNKQMRPNEVNECLNLRDLSEPVLKSVLEDLQNEGISGYKRAGGKQGFDFGGTRSHLLIQCWECCKPEHKVPLEEQFGHMRFSRECVVQAAERGGERGGGAAERGEKGHTPHSSTGSETCAHVSWRAAHAV